MIDGEDLRGLPLLERKRRLFAIMPSIESRIRFVDHIHETGIRLFELACERDLEGIVAKYARGIYQPDNVRTSWIKVKNSAYTQLEGRAELFEARRGRLEGPKRRIAPPTLVLC